MSSDSSNRAERTWLIYALGGGLGHLHRSLALANAVAKRNVQASEKSKNAPQIAVRILTNSPFASRIAPEAEATTDAGIVRIPHDWGREDTISRVREVIALQDFDTLIVDTFPRGLGGELPEVTENLECSRALVHRDLNSRYAEKAEVAQAIQSFDRILVPGESAAYDSLPQANRTAPWLIRDSQDLLAPHDARKKLRVASDKPVIAVLGCGKASELDEMRSIARRLADKFQTSAEVRFVSPLSAESNSASSNELIEITLWPFMDVLRGVSLVVGSGGYNTVHETSAVGVKLVGLPRRRMYDSQSQRLPSCDTAMTYQEIENAVELHLASHASEQTGPPPQYENGVHKAVEVIEATTACRA